MHESFHGRKLLAAVAHEAVSPEIAHEGLHGLCSVAQEARPRSSFAEELLRALGRQRETRHRQKQGPTAVAGRGFPRALKGTEDLGDLQALRERCEGLPR